MKNMIFGGTRIARLAQLLAIGAFASPALAEKPDYYPVFCQGISIDAGDNRMFVSNGFLYPLASRPDSTALPEGAIGKEFAQEVKRTSGKTLLDQTCHTRDTADELEAFITSTKRSNAATWAVVEMDWLPRAAHRLDADMAALRPVGGLAAPSSEKDAANAPAADKGASDRAAAAAARIAAEAAAAEQAAEAAREAARKEEAALRTLNASQLEASESERRKIQADKAEFATRQAAYEEGQRAYAAAVARHQAEVKAAENAREKWKADVAACTAGDYSRCSPSGM